MLFPAPIASLATVSARPVSAFQDNREQEQLEAVRVAEGPVIDGSLDEAVWQRAQSSTSSSSKSRRRAYNSLTDEWSTSARLNYIYRPGSDIYLVYDELLVYYELRRDGPGLEWIRDRRLLLKFTYLLSR